MSEKDFWAMTLAELDRYVASKKRIMRNEERERASFDYILADMIGRSIARIHNSSNKFPTIEAFYPTLFTKEELNTNKAQINRQRFMAGLQQFASFHNKEEVGKENE